MPELRNEQFFQLINKRPIAKNIQLVEETIRRLAEEDRKKQQDKNQWPQLLTLQLNSLRLYWVDR